MSVETTTKYRYLCDGCGRGLEPLDEIYHIIYSVVISDGIKGQVITPVDDTDVFHYHVGCFNVDAGADT